MSPLKKYKEKRDFRKTKEPKDSQSGNKRKPGKKKLAFVIQKHAASHLHYDLRLEHKGELKSWAVPKGPSLDTSVKRLAMMVEDHPYDYKDFEGIIPEGSYGAGTVIVWDEGYYTVPKASTVKEAEKLIEKGLKTGKLTFELHGSKLNGEFVMIRKASENSPKGNSWLLIKKEDEYSTGEDVLKQKVSVKSGKTIEQIADIDPIKKNLEKVRSQLKKEGIPASEMPENISPMLATLTDEPFDDKDWIFEIKWDGYRAIAEVNGEKSRIYSRKLKPFDSKFKEVKDSIKKLPFKAVFDGEIAVLDKDGHSDFHALQNYQRTGEGDLVYYIFDLLWLEGYDLMSLSLLERKKILKDILPAWSHLLFSDHIKQAGCKMYDAAVRMNIEGMIAKRSCSTYKPGKRVKDWLKVKVTQKNEFVIGGFTEPRKSRQYLGAILLGTYNKDGALVFHGHTGGGFNEKQLKEMRERLDELVSDRNPFSTEPDTNMKAHWVDPVLVAEVKYSEMTRDGILRHPVFIGLREDIEAGEVKMEIGGINEPSSSEKKSAQSDNPTNEEDGKNKFSTADISNPDKVFWPKEKIRKKDVLAYYEKISEYIMPHLMNRPESMRRMPDGIDGKSFFQKDIRRLKLPDWIETVDVESESKGMIRYMICNNRSTLLYMVNLGCIEVNPWLSKVQSPENPDYSLLDLDPVDIDFKAVVETALHIKEVLDAAQVSSLVKTSGSRGLHIIIPLGARYDYKKSRSFAEIIAYKVNRRIPGITSLKRSPAKRKGKVYIDYLQNRKGQTMAAPYSLRPKPGAPVSTPLIWKEVTERLNPLDYNINSIFERLNDIDEDLWRNAYSTGFDLKATILKMEKDY